MAPATDNMILYHEVQELARMIEMDPKIFDNSLLSRVKFSDAECLSILEKYNVNIYDSNDTLIKL